MHLVTIRRPDGETRAARIEGGEAVLLPSADVGALLGSGDDWRSLAGQDGPKEQSEELSLAPVVPHPSKVLCVGLNYLLHVREGGGEVPTHPTLFAKFPEALTGPHDEIVLPDASQRVDWEAELVVVVGGPARNATEEMAAAAIAGFTIGNDVSMRDWQRRTTQWLQGKTWEACSPVGPALVTTDEVGSVRPDSRGQLPRGWRNNAGRTYLGFAVRPCQIGGLRQHHCDAPPRRSHLHRDAGGCRCRTQSTAVHPPG